MRNWSPGRGLLRLLLAWLGLAVGVVAMPSLVGMETAPFWSVSGLALVLLVLGAAVQLATEPPWEARRRCPESLPLGEWTTVELELRTGRSSILWSARALDLEIFDHHPPSGESDGLPLEIRARRPAESGETTWTLAYRFRPRNRGAAHFGPVEIWQASSFDLLRRRQLLLASQVVRVLPNFRPILAQGLAGIEARMASLGFHLQRRRGEGLEFQELRDFRDGDSLRQVDWKATARRGRLVARQYQEERDQQVILLLDCGRRMHAREGDLTHLDHVLDASLLLGWVAHRQGDAVGLQAFAGEERWLPPVRGAGAVTRLLDALHDLQSSSESPDYMAAAERLLLRQRRRALVLLLTNLRDEDAEEILPALRSLRRRHLVVVASTREMAIDAMRHQPITDHASALEVTAAHHYLQARAAAHERLRSAGALVLDVEAPQLPHALVARYLEIKRAGQL